MKTIGAILYIAAVALTLNACTLPASASDPIAYAMLQSGGTARSDSEELKIAALEGLMSADPERSLPLVKKVLESNSSDDVKEKALFVLGQNDLPEAQALLVEHATRSGALQLEAIRMIGIGGVSDSLDQLKRIYSGASQDVREAVLQAYLIADDKASVFAIANSAASDEEFDAAIRTLGVMDATEELRQLLDKGADRESLMQAYAIAGDLQSLSRLAREASSPEQRVEAVRNIGIVGSEAAKLELETLYTQASTDDMREAALQGMLIADHDEGVLKLFRQTQNTEHKRDLLRMLVIMDSDLAIDVIDSTLLGE